MICLEGSLSFGAAVWLALAFLEGSGGFAGLLEFGSNGWGDEPPTSYATLTPRTALGA